MYAAPLKDLRFVLQHVLDVAALANTPRYADYPLEVDDEELEHRLLLRGKDSGRPDDANPDVIRRRIKEYNDKTTPVAEFYKNQNKFTSISGIGSIEEIFDSISAVTEAL